MPSQLHARTRPGPDAGMPKENFGVSSRPRIGGSISRVDTTYALVLPASCVTSPYRIEMFVSGTSSSGLPDQLTLRILHTVARQLRVNLPNVAPAIDGPSASTWYPPRPKALPTSSVACLCVSPIRPVHARHDPATHCALRPPWTFRSRLKAAYTHTWRTRHIRCTQSCQPRGRTRPRS